MAGKTGNFRTAAASETKRYPTRPDSGGNYTCSDTVHFVLSGDTGTFDRPDDTILNLLFPFQSHYFNIGESKLHFVDEGHGPVILMLHSCPLWSFEFRTLILYLRKNYRVIAIDQLGFGLSDKPVDADYRLEAHTDHLDRFCSVLGLKDITLLMHGRGATIGLGLAVRNPDNIRAIISMNAMAFSGFSLPLRLLPRRFKWIGSRLLMKMKIFRVDLFRLAKDVLHCYLYPFPSEDALTGIRKFIEDLPCVPEDESAQTMFEIESSIWMLKNKPACIIWAGRDWLYSSRSRKKWLKYFPKASFTFVPKAGRCLTEDAPEEVINAVMKFLRDNNL